MSRKEAFFIAVFLTAFALPGSAEMPPDNPQSGAEGSTVTPDSAVQDSAVRDSAVRDSAVQDSADTGDEATAPDPEPPEIPQDTSRPAATVSGDTDNVTPGNAAGGDSSPAAAETGGPGPEADNAVAGEDTAAVEEESDLTPPDLMETLDIYYGTIDDQEAEGGPYDAILSESYFGLGRVLHNSGKYEQALDAYRRSMHISRVNDGIYSLSQVPMLRGMIESQEAIGDWENASNSYQQIYWLHLKSYGQGDPKLIPVLNEISDWHLQAYVSDRSRETLHHLVTSHTFYNAAVELASNIVTPGHSQLIHLLRSVVVTSYYFAAHQRDYPGPARESGFTFTTGGSGPSVPSEEDILLQNSYINGRRAYERIISILYEEPDASMEEKAEAYAELGDWYLLFGRRSSAMSAYREAISMTEAGAEPALLQARIFGRPKMLPLIDMPNADSADQYVVATMDVTSMGSTRNVDIKESFPADDDSLRRKARKTLKVSKFRPRFENGEPVATEGLAMKIYLSD